MTKCWAKWPTIEPESERANISADVGSGAEAKLSLEIVVHWIRLKSSAITRNRPRLSVSQEVTQVCTMDRDARGGQVGRICQSCCHSELGQRARNPLCTRTFWDESDLQHREEEEEERIRVSISLKAMRTLWTVHTERRREEQSQI